jgi:hypothetical protein
MLKSKTIFQQHMDSLVRDYEDECCKFDSETNIKMLSLYLSRMEDSHLKCVLYKHLEGLENETKV